MKLLDQQVSAHLYTDFEDFPKSPQKWTEKQAVRNNEGIHPQTDPPTQRSVKSTAPSPNRNAIGCESMVEFGPPFCQSWNLSVTPPIPLYFFGGMSFGLKSTVRKKVVTRQKIFFFEK